ncbi:MAG: sortase [Pseudomonadota bacterium]
MRGVLKAAGAAIIFAGLITAAQGAYVPAKAWVGQILLEQAWEEGKATGTDVPPWEWADFAPEARITVPRLGVGTVVLNQASGSAMAWGPGHVAGTAPIGAPGLSAIAGHRDTHLAFTGDLRPGDRVDVDTGGVTHRFEVRKALVVDSRRWRFESRFSGPSTLVLSTCWPLDAKTPGPLRFIVYADRIEEAQDLG